jgi:glycosyltransferase involved in cell wall biosynthesis
MPLMRAIFRQTLLPTELILVNSGPNVLVSEALDELTSTCASLAIRFKVSFLKNLLLPGAARNRGLEDVGEQWVAFLDVDTIPEANWLEYQLGFIDRFGLAGSLGSIFYGARGNSRKLIRYAK